MTIKLGTYCKDKVSGIEGYTVGRIEHLTGCEQYTLQEPLGGDIAGRDVDDPYNFDEIRLEIDHTKPVLDIERDSSLFDTGRIKLGMFVIDQVTGFKGCVVSKGTYSDGHLLFGIQGPALRQEGKTTKYPSLYVTPNRLIEDPEKTAISVFPEEPQIKEETSLTKKKSPKTTGRQKKGADSLLPKMPQD